MGYTNPKNMIIYVQIESVYIYMYIYVYIYMYIYMVVTHIYIDIINYYNDLKPIPAGF